MANETMRMSATGMVTLRQREGAVLRYCNDAANHCTYGMEKSLCIHSTRTAYGRRVNAKLGVFGETVGPIALFDKSFLQSLSLDESVWFDHFFLPVVSPLFFVETLADLTKQCPVSLAFGPRACRAVSASWPLRSSARNHG